MGKFARDVIVGIRFTRAEAEAARRGAEAAGVTVVAYIRSAVVAAIRRDQSRAAREAQHDEDRDQLVALRGKLFQSGVRALSKGVTQ